MFKELNALRGQVSSLGLAMKFVADGRMTVIVTPVLNDKVEAVTPGLATPFALTGSPEELDAEFSSQFSGFATVFSTLEAQANTQIAALKKKTDDDAAEKKVKANAQANSAKASSFVSKGKDSIVSASALADALTGGTPVIESESSEDDERIDQEPAKQEAATTAPQAATSLFA